MQPNHRPHDLASALRLSLLLAMGLGAGACDGGKEEDSAGSPVPCASASPILDASGAPTGYERCGDGAVNRVEVRPVVPQAAGPACAGTEEDLSCTTDADCVERAHGYCVSGIQEMTYCGCVYTCEGDDDCAEGQACLPPGVIEGTNDWATCVAATCATNADCDSGQCGVSSYNDGCGYTQQLGCRTGDDTCRVADDCDDAGATCGIGYSETGTFDCQQQGCAIGRPLHAEALGPTRVAPTVPSRGWSRALPAALPTDPALRRALGQRWASVAALEHASVASFARATLQLLSFGAPPALLRDHQAAGLDEVAHAELAYGVASQLLGEPVGPGPLSLAGLSINMSLEDALWTLVVEGCVGETVGAAEARAAAEGVPEGPLRAALLTVAEDEARHAALAWRTLRWMLTIGGASLRERAIAAVEQGVAELSAGAPADADTGADAAGEAVAAAWGCLSAGARRALHQRIVAGVVRPCLAAVLQAPAAR